MSDLFHPKVLDIHPVYGASSEDFYMILKPGLFFPEYIFHHSIKVKTHGAYYRVADISELICLLDKTIFCYCKACRLEIVRMVMHNTMTLKYFDSWRQHFDR